MRPLPLLLLLACGNKDDSVAIDTAFCADAPVVTWASFGQGFTIENCQSCHASTTADRYGAPEDVVFDSFADVKAQSDLILAVATGDDPSMPPEGGVDEDDRARLEYWLRCWLQEDPG